MKMIDKETYIYKMESTLFGWNTFVGLCGTSVHIL